MCWPIAGARAEPDWPAASETELDKGQLTVRISLTCITAHYSANIRSPPKCPAPLRISLIVRASSSLQVWTIGFSLALCSYAHPRLYWYCYKKYHFILHGMVWPKPIFLCHYFNLSTTVTNTELLWIVTLKSWVIIYSIHFLTGRLSQWKFALSAVMTFILEFIFL